MAKKNKDSKRGLGRGLDSLIPKIDDDGEKSNNSSLTLEDILSNSEKEKNEIDEISEEKKDNEKISEEKEDKPGKNSNKKSEKKVSESEEGYNENEKIDQEVKEINEIEEIKDETVESDENFDKITEELIKETPKEDALEENVEKNEKEEQEKLVLSDYELASIEEVKEIIEKNPRITLWSAKSSAVFRYLRKTRPEFSISKEASELIDQAVSEKYPEIWKLFEDL